MNIKSRDHQTAKIGTPWLLTLAGAIALTLSCTPTQVGYNVVSITRVQEFFAPGIAGSLSWENYDVYEFHDTQQWSDAPKSTTYGPTASIFAAPGLKDFKMADFETAEGQIVAVVFIADSTHPLPSTYSDIGLNGDFTCLILQHSTTTGWSAYAVKSQPAKKCPTDATEPSRRPLAVQRPAVSTYPADSFPPVARFEATQSGRIAFGLRCADQWCDIGLTTGDQVEDAEHVNAPGEKVSAKSRIRGWYDDQYLGVIHGVGPFAKMHPELRASIVPEDSIGIWTATDYKVTNTYTSGKMVSRAYIKGALPKHYRDAGLKQGWNQLWLRQAAGSGADTLWTARFIAENGHAEGPWLKVIRNDHHNHSITVPATARWAWADLDEEIWVDCDVGCCRVLAERS